MGIGSRSKHNEKRDPKRVKRASRAKCRIVTVREKQEQARKRRRMK